MLCLVPNNKLELVGTSILTCQVLGLRFDKESGHRLLQDVAARAGETAPKQNRRPQCIRPLHQQSQLVTTYLGAELGSEGLEEYCIMSVTFASTFKVGLNYVASWARG